MMVKTFDEQVILLIQKNYWRTLADQVFNQKLLIFFVTLTTALCFGFTITNYSIGVDDVAREYYLYSNKIGNMIQQGRILHVVFNWLTNTVDFIPYFNDFVGAVLFALSALLYCGLFQYITDNKLSTASLIAFSCVYISSSILAEKFIYHLDVVVTMLSYGCSAIVLMYAYRFVKEKKLSLFWKAVPVLMIAIASYETFIFLYFCGVFAVFLLEMTVNQEKKTLKDILREGIRYALILLAAMALYYGLVAVMQKLVPTEAGFERYNIFYIIRNSGLGVLGTLSMLTQSIFQYISESCGEGYVPIAVFVMLSGVGAALTAILSWKQKNGWIVVCYVALWVGNLFVHYIIGSFTTRAAQTFCFFTGFVVLVLFNTVGVRPLCRKVLIAAVAVLVYVQAADMNRWFYNDYVRYEKESFIVQTLANKIVTEYDASKPLIFTNSPTEGYLNEALYEGRQVNGNSVIYWAGYAFNDKTQPFITELFRIHGYDFIVSPTPEQYDQAVSEAEIMPVWPEAGSVQEFDDFIVVNFG